MSAFGFLKGVRTPRTDNPRINALIKRLRPRLPGMELIRLGPNRDGGYLLPDDMDGVAACFSPGVGDVSEFESDCADRGMRVFMADGSVDGPAASRPEFNFVRKNIGAVNSAECITLEKWTDDYLPKESADLLLQMDIEGAEYAAFLSAPERLMRRFRIIAAEFHFLHYLCSRPFWDVAAAAFAKILATHDCVHIHPNNHSRPKRRLRADIPPAMEFIFLRKDRMRESGFATEFPHPLDFDNNENLPSLPLPEIWYK